MTTTKMSLDTLWLCTARNHFRFWTRLEDLLSFNLYGIHWSSPGYSEHIRKEWLRRFIINNWEEIAPQLQALFEFGPVDLALKKDVPPTQNRVETKEEQTEHLLKVVDDQAA